MDSRIGALAVTISDLRGAEIAYLAPNQTPGFWMRRVTDLSDQLGSGITRLRSAVVTPAARRHLDAAATALTDLGTADKRARDALQAGQPAGAADAIFVDGLNASQALAGEFTGARVAEAQAVDAAVAADSTLRLGVTGGALGVILLIALVAGRSRRPPATSEAATMAQMLRELPPPVKPPVPAPAVKPPPPVAAIPLAEAAELCVDLARVMDARDIPALLERAARALNATGVIVWVINRESTMLFPVLTHGYSDRVLVKLGSLEVDGDNMTSLSFRSIRPQTMLGAPPDTSGAIAVPLVTTGGCNGVLAAEVRDAKPSPEALALARIIAAQFATMISPCEATEPKAAEA